jgi:glucokinase
MSGRVTIGVDLGGTVIKLVIVATDESILARKEARTEARSTGERLLEQVSELTEQILSEVRDSDRSVDIGAVGLAVPGVVDSQKGRVEFTVALTEDWNGFAVAPALETKLGMPTFLINDAQAATVGEHRQGGGRGYRHFVNVTIGTGIGGGLILDDRLYPGSRGMSGVLGHTTVLPNGPPCDCGNRGCLEVVASGTAMTQAAREAVEAGLFTVDPADPDLSPEALAQRARRGDAVARKLFERAGEYIGIGLGNVVCLLNPQAIVIGGGVSRAGEILLEPIRREIAWRTTVFSPERGGVDVIRSPLGGEAGAIGSAVWARQQIGWA